MVECRKASALLPKSWKKSFNSGINKPTKMRFCNECNDERTCKICNMIVKEKKGFEANLNILKREAANEFGHMLPCFKE